MKLPTIIKKPPERSEFSGFCSFFTPQGFRFSDHTPRGHTYTNEQFLLQLYKCISPKHREVHFLLIKKNFWGLVVTLELVYEILPHSEPNLSKSILAQYSCDGHRGQLHIQASSPVCPGKGNRTYEQGRHKHTNLDHPLPLPTEDVLEETCMHTRTHAHSHTETCNIFHGPATAEKDYLHRRKMQTSSLSLIKEGSGMGQGQKDSLPFSITETFK